MTIQLARGSAALTLRTRFLLTVTAVAALACSRMATLALPPLPDDFINDDAIMFAVFDLAQATPSAIDATGRGVIEFIPEFGEQIATIRRDHEAFLNAGGRYIVIAAADTQSNDLYAFMPVAGVYVDAEHCDETALTELIRKHSAEVVSDPVIERHGDWVMLWKADRMRLINRKEDGPLLEIPNFDPVRADRLRAAFAALNGRSVGLMMVPTDEMHEEAQREFGQLDPDNDEYPAAIPMLLASAVQIHGWIDLGHNPSVTSVIELPEATMATQLTRLIQGLPKAFNAEMDGLDEMLDEAEMQLPPEVKLMYKVLHSYTCMQQGSTVTVSIGQAKLRPILDLAGPILEKQREQAKKYQAMNQQRQIGMSLIMYATDHDNQWPASLDDLVAGGQVTREQLDELLTHPITGEKIAFKYVKPDRRFDELEDPGSVVVLYELKNGQINREGCICYADGHVEMGERQ